MQHAFCTNCGKPLTPGEPFCPSCGTRVESAAGAASAPYNTMQAGYSAPGAQPPPMSPQQGAPGKPPQQHRTAQIVGVVGGCLVLFLVVVGLLIVSLIYGITSHHLAFFVIGVAGLFVILLVIVAIEHIIRRLYRRVAGGVERLEHPGYTGSRYQAGSRRYQRQQGFRPIRFLLTLIFLAAAALGGLYLYDTYTFNGDWTGTLTTGATQQGIVADFQVSLSFHKPSGFSISNLGAFDFETLNIKPTTAQVCSKGSQVGSYQLSGTASRLDASQAAMTLAGSSGSSLQLQGTYQNGTFTLKGTSGGQPVTLILQKSSQQGAATCQQAGG